MKCICGSGLNDQIKWLLCCQQSLYGKITGLQWTREQLTRQSEVRAVEVSGLRETIARLEEENTKLRDRAQDIRVDDFAAPKLRERIEELERGLRQIYLWTQPGRLIASQIEKLLPK